MLVNKLCLSVRLWIMWIFFLLNAIVTTAVWQVDFSMKTEPGTTGEVDKISLGADVEHGLGVILAQKCNLVFLGGRFGGWNAGHHASGEGAEGDEGPRAEGILKSDSWQHFAGENFISKCEKARWPLSDRSPCKMSDWYESQRFFCQSLQKFQK